MIVKREGKGARERERREGGRGSEEEGGREGGREKREREREKTSQPMLITIESPMTINRRSFSLPPLPL